MSLHPKSVLQINDLGVSSQHSLQDPVFIRRPAFNRENTVIDGNTEKKDHVSRQIRFDK